MADPQEITPEDSVVPVYLEPLTPEQEADRAAWHQESLDRAKAEQAKADARKTAEAKLAKLGLTPDEIAALIG